MTDSTTNNTPNTVQTIFDWRVAEGYGDLSAVESQPFRMKVTICDGEGFYFSVIPESQDNLTSEVLGKRGLTGRVDIRTGRPMLTIGHVEDEYPIYADLISPDEVFVFTDRELHAKPEEREIDGFGYKTKGTRYTLDNERSWLREARSVKAQQAFAEHLFPHKLPVAGKGSWSVIGDVHQLVVFFENPAGGDSIKGLFEVEFYPGEILVRTAG